MVSKQSQILHIFVEMKEKKGFELYETNDGKEAKGMEGSFHAKRPLYHLHYIPLYTTDRAVFKSKQSFVVQRLLKATLFITFSCLFYFKHVK